MRTAVIWGLAWALGLSGFASVVTAQVDAERVLTVPCVGSVGEEITAEGLRDALRRAERQKVSKVILEVDSPGGYVYEANALIEVLRENDEAFEIVTVVTGDALSAATVFLAAADRWVVTPGANIGAATAFSEDSSTGSVDVDAKFNSVWASSLAGLAMENDWSGDLFRAMVERGVTLYAGWTGAEGTPAVFSRNWPEDMDRVKRIDTDETVLALHSADLVELGLATVVDDPGLDEIAKLMDWGAVRTAGRYGITSMARAAKTRAALASDMAELREQLEYHTQQAAQTDPRGLRLYFDRDTMLLTGASQRAWSRAAEASLGHWVAAERIMTRMARLDQRIERAGALHLAVDRESADGLYKSIAENVSYLRANMRRTHYEFGP